jgi:dolichol-phosphate mannosyltransferase
METSYKVLRSALWQRLTLRGTRFDIEPDITARILWLGYRIHEVPIRYYARSREEGKKLTWMDGLRAIGTLVKRRLASDRQLFGPGHDRAYHEARHEEVARSHPLIKPERS